jgi:hypothetical protein
LSTISEGGTVLFRVCDFDEIVRCLEQKGCSVEPLDFRLDNSPSDFAIDFPPCLNPHFKLVNKGFVTTSIGLIIKKLEN